MEETLQIQEEDEIKMDMEQELPCGEREQLQAEWDRLLQERQQLAREREQLENETAHLRSRFEEERKQLKKDMLRNTSRIFSVRSQPHAASKEIANFFSSISTK